jgi:hypothetical protein
VRIQFRRGVLRIWIALSGVWICYWIWHYATVCYFDPDPGLVGCSIGKIDISPYTPSGRYTISVYLDPMEILLKAFGIPIAVLATGWVVAWVNPGLPIKLGPYL